MLIRALAASLAVGAAVSMPSGAAAQPTNFAAIADAAWPGSHCVGQLDVRYVPEIVLQGLLNDRRALDGGYVADGAGCTVYVRDGLQGTTRGCETVVHEAGHAAGRDIVEPIVGRFGPDDAHTNNGSVMDPSGGYWAPCHRPPAHKHRAKPRPRHVVRSMIRGLLPASTRYRWTVYCTPSLKHCSAKLWGHSTRYYKVSALPTSTIVTYDQKG